MKHLLLHVFQKLCPLSAGDIHAVAVGEKRKAVAGVGEVCAVDDVRAVRLIENFFGKLFPTFLEGSGKEKRFAARVINDAVFTVGFQVQNLFPF